MVSKIVGTDTASFCIFDLTCLKHKLDDDCDWWSIPRDEIAEVNKGNCVIFGTGADGGYKITVTTNDKSENPDIEAYIKAPTGKIYIGPGEDITGEDYEPEVNSEYYHGIFIDINPGAYAVSISRVDSEISINLATTDNEPSNNFKSPLRVDNV